MIYLTRGTANHFYLQKDIVLDVAHGGTGLSGPGSDNQFLSSLNGKLFWTSVSVGGSGVGPPGPTGPTGPTGPVGPTGPTGPTGLQGIPGTPGASGSVGPTGPIGATGASGSSGTAGASGLSFIWLGTYSPTNYYKSNNAVYYNGSSYVNTSACSGILPTFTSNWNILALAGTNGASGATGPQGPTGSTGASGSVGPTGATGVAGAGFIWLGNYSGSTLYVPNNVVYYLGSSYVNVASSISVLPTNLTNWNIVASVGAPGSGGSGGIVTGSITFSASAALNPTTLNLSSPVSGFIDWLAMASNAGIPRQLTTGILHNKTLGGFQLGANYDWVAGGNSNFAVFTQNFVTPALNSTAIDDASSSILSANVGGQGIDSTTTGATGFGFRLVVPASTVPRILTIYTSSFSAVCNCTATLTDKSAGPVTQFYDTGAATAAERYFQITYNSSGTGYLVVSVICTVNHGSTPNIKFSCATLS